MATTVDVAKLRLQFFEFLFGNEEGRLCIAIGNATKDYFKQEWFKWPDERVELSRYVESKAPKFNVWFGISLFSQPERKRVYAVPGNRVWSDLDFVNPLELDNGAQPNIIIESSPGRYQGIWSFPNVMPPDVAMDYSKRLAYAIGADKSGWDLEQLLRVPWTFNLKYTDPAEVKLLRIDNTPPSLDYFEKLPIITELNTGNVIIDDAPDVPKIEDLPKIETIIEKHKKTLNNPMEHHGTVFVDLVTHEPTEGEDWSARLWRLINFCLELGFSEEETFAVAIESKCNKYARDNRPISHLWRDVLKAAQKQNKITVATKTVELAMPQIVDPDDVTEDSFVAEYKQWANEATDAPEQYHELSCFIALSSVVSQGLALELPYNSNFRPNLWGLLLGESTLSRKTTSMRMAMDLLTDLDSELILASDGSAEGLLTGLSGRPKRVSLFYKDEVSGFFDSINRKDYLAGFPETLTQLYDVPKVLARILRKETITVTEPYFIFFGGGIRDKVYGLINDDYVLSGFIPRFLIVSSSNDISRIRRTGPPTSIGSDKKDKLVTRLADLKERYSVVVPAKVGQQTVYLDGRIEAYLTPQAWDFFGDIEESLPLAAMNTPWELLALPTLSRMSFSLLKMGMLIAASRREPSDANKLEVGIDDLKQAAYYIQKWGQYSLDLIMASGKSTSEKQLERALVFIRSTTEGVTQTQLMQRFHLTSREMKEIRDTLYDRGLVDLDKRGRGFLIKALRF